MNNEKVLELTVTEFSADGKVVISYPDKDKSFPITATCLLKGEKDVTLQIKGDLLAYIKDALVYKGKIMETEPIYKASLHVASAEKNYISWMSFELTDEKVFSSNIQHMAMPDSDRMTVHKKYRNIHFLLTENDVAPMWKKVPEEPKEEVALENKKKEKDKSDEGIKDAV